MPAPHRGGGAPRVATETLLDRLLQASSRTFALTIPLLREPTRREVTIAYLLFRVADSIEDSTRWPRDGKLQELEALRRFLEAPSGSIAAPWRKWAEDPPLDHPGYRELLGEFPSVMRAAESLAPEAWRLVSSHTAKTCRAMASFVERERDGVLRLKDLGDLRAYCYAVAGIVGEMLTELFLLDPALGPIASVMRDEAPLFGEALQLVNILKDRAADAREGRCYLPEEVDPADVFALARRDLAVASDYCARLERFGADSGIVAFTALPALLAFSSLGRVERDGPGAKITRAEVSEIVAALHEAVDRKTVGKLLETAGGSPRRPGGG
jgi:farnesyl-diphosphate farnesyltransferase